MFRKKDKTVKHSLRMEMTATFLALLAVTAFASLAANVLFLNSIYLNRKENVLKSAYVMISEANEDGCLDDEDFTKEMEKLASRNNISAIVLSASGASLFSTGAGSDILRSHLQSILFSGDGAEEILYQNDSYSIEKVDDHMRDTGEYLVLYGNLDADTMVMMRVAMESLNDSVSVSLQFTAMISVLCTIIGGLIIFFVTGSITKPLLEMTDISKSMAELDFDVKYKKKSKDNKNELDLLGQHLNELAFALEHSISDLKTANNEMKLDIDRKEQIEMMRTDFLSNVSHELKTPLALIQGYAEGLKDSVNDDSESRDFYCDVIIDEADKMNKMVKKLLTLNQLEFGVNEITMERFNVTELISSVVSSMGIMLEKEEIAVEFAQNTPVDVWADEYKIEEVLTNYMSNAIHHIGGEKQIRIWITPKEDVARISVFNTGTPIPDEDLARLWEKFYKVDKSHSRQYGGHGIGLSIVKAIMDALHQACGVENHEDGVEFWFELDTSVGRGFADTSITVNPN